MDIMIAGAAGFVIGANLGVLIFGALCAGSKADDAEENYRLRGALIRVRNEAGWWVDPIDGTETAGSMAIQAIATTALGERR